ncbi:PREDICTED: methenyltetrahydrofolate synthase domain-containing protein [Nanorana parkeri]|uniref:methenyltetrahydrofolate synthase domain-containing protein n=1 Tax=Nanorana parkeri TaxID=125878 RepID=UPI0008544186|nr:PREDICTED: methenyltetrahydrofolate synthase domain-containing protein [Nanorana parkeri]
MEPALTLSAGCSKWDIRQKIWDYIEKNNLADFPRPVHHRIPNFKGAAGACERLRVLREFQEATTIKINPDTPQKNARFLTLEAQKTLLVPTPRLRTGLFNRITPPPGATKELLRICSTSQVGHPSPLSPLGSSCRLPPHTHTHTVWFPLLSPSGWRIGKGEGFADMEYAMMVAMGAVTDQTIVVTVVHDCQVLAMPEELLDDHDLTVDYILTPTRVIKTDCTRPKPKGIIWSKCPRDAFPVHLTWQGAQRRAFLNYGGPAHAELVLAKLEGLNIEGHPLRVEMARGQRSRAAGVPEEQRP